MIKKIQNTLLLLKRFILGYSLFYKLWNRNQIDSFLIPLQYNVKIGIIMVLTNNFNSLIVDYRFLNPKFLVVNPNLCTINKSLN